MHDDKMEHKMTRDFRNLGHHPGMVHLHPGMEHLSNDVRIDVEVNIHYCIALICLHNVIFIYLMFSYR